MSDPIDEPSAELLDITGVSLSELQVREDTPFVRALGRIVAENDDPDAFTVVAFQSAI